MDGYSFEENEGEVSTPDTREEKAAESVPKTGKIEEDGVERGLAIAGEFREEYHSQDDEDGDSDSSSFSETSERGPALVRIPNGDDIAREEDEGEQEEVQEQGDGQEHLQSYFGSEIKKPRVSSPPRVRNLSPTNALLGERIEAEYDGEQMRSVEGAATTGPRTQNPESVESISSIDADADALSTHNSSIHEHQQAPSRRPQVLRIYDESLLPPRSRRRGLRVMVCQHEELQLYLLEILVALLPLLVLCTKAYRIFSWDNPVLSPVTFFAWVWLWWFGFLVPAILFAVLSYYVYGLWMRSMKAKKKTADHDKEGEGEEAKEKGGDGVMESVQNSFLDTATDSLDSMSDKIRDTVNEVLFDGEAVILDPCVDMVILFLYLFRRSSEGIAFIAELLQWKQSIKYGLALCGVLFALFLMFCIFRFSVAFGFAIESALFLFGVYWFSIDIVCAYKPTLLRFHLLHLLDHVRQLCLLPPSPIDPDRYNSSAVNDAEQPTDGSSTLQAESRGTTVTGASPNSLSVPGNPNITRVQQATRPRMGTSGDSKSPEVSSSEKTKIRTDPNHIIRSGYLVKRGQKRKAWRRRFFVLSPGMLTYYKRERDTVPNGRIPLKYCLLSQVVIRSAKGRVTIPCFQLYHTVTGRHYIIRCPSEFDKMCWMHDLFQEVSTVEVMDEDMMMNKDGGEEEDGSNSDTPVEFGAPGSASTSHPLFSSEENESQDPFDNEHALDASMGSPAKLAVIPSTTPPPEESRKRTLQGANKVGERDGQGTGSGAGASVHVARPARGTATTKIGTGGGGSGGSGTGRGGGDREKGEDGLTLQSAAGRLGRDMWRKSVHLGKLMAGPGGGQKNNIQQQQNTKHGSMDTHPSDTTTSNPEARTGRPASTRGAGRASPNPGGRRPITERQPSIKQLVEEEGAVAGVAEAAAEDVLLTAWVRKKRTDKRTIQWKKRFLVLRSQTLDYYQHEEEPHAMGSMPLISLEVEAERSPDSFTVKVRGK